MRDSFGFELESVALHPELEQELERHEADPYRALTGEDELLAAEFGLGWPWLTGRARAVAAGLMARPWVRKAEPGDVVDGWVVYARTVKKYGSTAWRNNNPGNITWPAHAAPSYGAFFNKRNGAFAIFPTWDTGYYAIRKKIEHHGSPAGGNLDLRGLGMLWAKVPGTYPKIFAKGLGLPESTKISSLKSSQIMRLVDLIVQHEGQHPGLDPVTGNPGVELQRDHPDLPASVRS